MTYTLVGIKDYIDKEIEKILKDFDKESVCLYDLENISIKKVIEDLNTVSLFGKKCIIANNLEFLDSDSDLIKYLENETDNVLILTSKKALGNKKKIDKFLKEKTKYKELFEYNLNTVIKENLEGYKMSNMDINVLISYCNNDLKRVESELEKLKIYKFKEKEIIKFDIEKLVKKGYDSTIFNLIDAINSKDKSLVKRIVSELIEEGETLEKILYTIANHYRLLYQIKLKTKHMNDSDIISEYKMHPYRLTKLKNQCYLVDEDTILWMLKNLSEIDIAIKQGKQDISTAMFLFFEKL